MKIISLQSVGLGTANRELKTGAFPEELFVKVGSPNPFIGASRVVLIELIAGNEQPMQRCDEMSYYDQYYKVITSDGHIRVLPEQSYIAEWVDDDVI
ncbi:hypothetical protein LOOC260_109670 [Paucilactobacillus hokkaidonensis JCM 18461]|uniref:Uncharacterized protein n=2 Tax=Paucilactobacillus hokkaidonensis TaxID=1193095 RepID=A0A0A1GYF9_9LACO|nr:hypothetical protein [Paucilactobacillus hokkaidonensis]KRO07674.1 hypothetical protein IV59_GL001765 [Paucilactobacillus hokkaidonensis]BAP85506.1 hypothetical protein LOOC260_109670 [Paucilactobacillus hokkaidonensis JCM 18461]